MLVTKGLFSFGWPCNCDFCEVSLDWELDSVGTSVISGVSEKPDCDFGKESGESGFREAVARSIMSKTQGDTQKVRRLPSPILLKKKIDKFGLSQPNTIKQESIKSKIRIHSCHKRYLCSPCFLVPIYYDGKYESCPDKTKKQLDDLGHWRRSTTVVRNRWFSTTEKMIND